jgi:hypothetical protein
VVQVSTADFLAPPLARMARCSRRAENVGLSYVRTILVDGVGVADPTGRRTNRASRLLDAYSLATAAWAEITDREPTIAHRARLTDTYHDQVRTRPWKNGKDSAWGYLQWMAADRLWGGPARQIMGQLARSGLTPPVPEEVK